MITATNLSSADPLMHDRRRLMTSHRHTK